MSAEQGEGPNFDLLDAVEYWEVPIEGGPPPDNPVPSANGARYSPPAGAAPPAPPAADADLFTTENGGGFGGPAENGHMPMVRAASVIPNTWRRAAEDNRHFPWLQQKPTRYVMQG